MSLILRRIRACGAFAATIWSSVGAVAWAQEAENPATCTRRGPIHRMIHHSSHTLKDKFIGYPETFVEPPLGYFVREQMAVQVAKADPHRFTLYHTDFLPGTSQWSPIGASRFNIMYSKLASWPGPILIEWTPDKPELADQRRKTVVALLEKSRTPMGPERVVIGPSPYPGALGAEAIGVFGNQLQRNQGAGTSFPLPPNVSASSGVH